MVANRRWRLVGQPGIVMRWLAYALFLGVPLVFSLDSYRVFAPAKRALFVSIIAFLSFGDRAYLVERIRAIRRCPADIALTVFVAFMSLSLLWTSQVGTGLPAVMVLVCWVFGYLLLQHHVTYEDDVHRILFAAGAALAVNLVLGAFQLLGWWLPASLAGPEAPIGWIGNRNWFAVFVALSLPVEIWNVKHTASRLRRGLALFNVVLGLPLLLLTWCRGAWAAFGAALLMWLLMRAWGNDVARLKRRVAIIVCLALLLMVGLLALPIVAPQAFISLWGQTKQQTLESRFLAYRIAWSGIRQAPLLGHGIGSFGGDFVHLQEQWFADFPQRSKGLEWRLARPFRHVHNDALELAYEGGLVGILLALVTVFYVTRRFFTHAQRIPEGPLRSLSHLVFSVSTGFAVASIASFPFRQTTATLLLMFFMAAMTLDLGGGKKDPDDPSVVVTGAALFICLFVFSLALLDYMSEAARGRALVALAQGKVGTARQLADGALKFNPLNGRAMGVLGRCYVNEEKYDQAVEQFTAAAAHHLDHTFAYNLGVIAVQRGAYQEAVQQFSRAVRQKPGPDTLTALANVHRLLDEDDEAERLYRLALEFDRGYHEAGFQLARLVARRSKAEAIELLQGNIAVIDARLAQGLGGVEAAVILVKSLKALSGLAEAAGQQAIHQEAQQRLDAMDSSP